MIVEYLPPVIKKIREMQEICRVEQPYFDEAAAEIENILCRAFISLADEKGVARFEEIYGITPTEDQTLEERRVAILIRSSKKNLSLTDVTNLLYNYSDEILLEPNYNTDELTVIVGEHVNNLSTIYKTLDDLISLQVLIQFAMEITTKTSFIETPKEITLETTVNLLNDKAEFWKLDGSYKLDGEKYLDAISWKQEIEAILESGAKITETFNDIELTTEKDYWILDGSETLNGGRLLDAEIYKEVID